MLVDSNPDSDSSPAVFPAVSCDAGFESLLGVFRFKGQLLVFLTSLASVPH
jgi:hypothetical protein